MSQIPIEHHNGRFLECIDQQCIWSLECTNHYTAGDYRMDGGLRPALTGYNKEGKIAWCSTKDSILPLDSHEHGEYVNIVDVPPQTSLW